MRVGWEGVGSEYHGIYNSYISVPCSSMRISKFAADDDRRPPSSSDAGQSRTAEQNDSPTAISQRVPREFGVLNIAVSLPAHAFKATNCGCWMCWRQHKRGNCLKGARRGGEVSGVCPSSMACARKSPPRGCTLKKQDKTRHFPLPRFTVLFCLVYVHVSSGLSKPVLKAAAELPMF